MTKQCDPRLRYQPEQHRFSYCQSNGDGDCEWEGCPQLRDNEPTATGRHCPLDIMGEDDEC